MLSALSKIGVRAPRGARQILADVYRREARRMGLAFTTHYPPLMEFYDMLCATLGPDFLESRGYGIREVGLLMKPFSPGIGNPDPVAHAIMASSLFNNPNDFYENMIKEIELNEVAP